MKQWLAVAAVLWSATLWGAGWQSVGAVSSVQQIQNGAELRAGAAAIRITLLSSSVVRVRYAPHGTFPPDHSWAVVEHPDFAAPRAQMQDTKDSVEISAGEVRVRVEKATGRLVFLSAAGDAVLQEQPGNGAMWNGDAFRISWAMPEDAHYFGLGDKTGPLDRRDHAYTDWNTDIGWQESTDPLYKSIPFLLAMRRGRAYGLFLDNTWRSWFDFGKESRDYFSFGADGGELNFYFFSGPDPKKVVSDYTALTGRMPLPPLATLGFQQCRYSYFPEARVREIARQFRERRIPVDILYLDIDYQQDNKPFTVDRQRFPDFEPMVHDLGQQGFKIVLITDLHIAKQPGYKPYDEGMARNLFAHNPDGSVYSGRVWPGDSVFPDFTWAPAREFWGSLYKDFVNMGIRGFWNDMNEPAVFTYPSKTIPLDVVSRSDFGGTITQREAHNIFGMENVRATYEGLLKLKPDQRPFVLTRAAFSGAQRYAATWTGDNSSTWNHYRISIPQILNLGLSGFAFTGADVGGFNGSPPADLLTRWIELGVFYPLFRDHTTKGSAEQEPWVHGFEHETIRRHFIETRYKLLPYIYTQMEETARTGVPLMRPMFMEFPDFLPLETEDREFMFGSSMLIAPKVTEDPGRYYTLLAPGAWYDYWTGVRYDGGSSGVKLSLAPALDVLPAFVRAGSIIPHQQVIQSTAEKPQGRLELRVYPGPNCHGTVYADDGDTLAYQRGAWQRTDVTCSPDGTRIDIATPQGQFKPWWNEFTVTIVGYSPRTILVDGKAVATFELEGNQNSVSFNTPAGRAVSITAQYGAPPK